jgi:hypothetical protein
MSSFLFRPHVGTPSVWRGVRIEIKPDQTRVEWRNEQGEFELVSTITPAMLHGTIPDMSRPLPNVQLDPSPRTLNSPVGIIATRCMVSFRNVRIEPLKP